MDILGEFINPVQNPIYPESHHTLIPLGLDVHVTGPLVKGVAEQVVHGIHNMLIRGGQLIVRPEANVLLQIPQIHRRPGKLVLCCHDRALETEKLIDHLNDICLGADHRLDFQLAGMSDVPNGLLIKGVWCGHRQESIFDGDGEDQVFHGEALGYGGGHQVEVQLKGIYFLVGDLPGLGEGLVDGLLVQYGEGVVRSLQLQVDNHIHNVYGIDYSGP